MCRRMEPLQDFDLRPQRAWRGKKLEDLLGCPSRLLWSKGYKQDTCASGRGSKTATGAPALGSWLRPTRPSAQ
jgi:hypothetical protein